MGSRAPRKEENQDVPVVSSHAEDEPPTLKYNNLADISTIVAKHLRFAGDFATIFYRNITIQAPLRIFAFRILRVLSRL